MKRVCGRIVLMAMALAPARAIADEGVTSRMDFLGAPREISHGDSASPDAAALQMLFAPRPTLMGGGEIGLVKLTTGLGVFRLGVVGFLEVDSASETTRYFPVPGNGVDFWRGHVAYQLAFSPTRFASSVCSSCTWEALVGLHHESEHYTGGNEGGPAQDFSDVPQVGDMILADVAVRYRAKDLALTVRVQDHFFLPGRSAYTNKPSADLVARWQRWRKLHLFSSAYLEYMFGGNLPGGGPTPDAYLVRNLTGMVLPSDIGDIFVFLTAAVGHRRGLNVLTEERSLGAGVRVVFD